MNHKRENNGSDPDKLHVITSESFDPKSKLQSAVTAVEDEGITPEEQKQLAGLDESFDDRLGASLISKEYQYSQSESEHKDIADLAIPRTVLVLILIGGAVMVVLFMFIGFGGSGKKKAQKQIELETEAEVVEESDQYKAQLAVVDQKREQRQTSAEADRTRAAQLEQSSDSALNKEQEESAIQKTQKSPRRRAPRVAPPESLPPPRQPQALPRRQSLATPPSRSSPKPRVPEPEVDPQQRWNLLAAAGTQHSDSDISTSVSVSEDPQLSSEEVISLPQTQQAPQQTQLNASVAYRQSYNEPTHNERSPDTTENILDAPPTNQDDRTRTVGIFPSSDSNSNQISRVLIGSPKPNEANSDFNIGTRNAITEGARGIISRQQVQFTSAKSLATQTNHVVPIGSTASAKITVPIIWAEDGTSPTAGRFAVTLTEALMDRNGEIALPKNTVLITEVTEITPDSHLVYQSVVALVYRDRNGRIQQQEIPPNNLIIRGKRNQPLIAKSLRGSNGSALKQDLLVGVLSSLGKVGEIVNRPEEEIIREDDGFDSYRRERRTNSREADIFAAALEGFFDTTADRLDKRSEQSMQEQLARKNVLVVPEGEKATVYVNAFLEVQR